MWIVRDPQILFLSCFLRTFMLFFPMVWCVFHCSVMIDSEVPWTVACQAPLSMELSRQEYWSGLPLLLQGIFLNQGLLNLRLASPELAGRFFTPGATWEGQWFGVITLKSTQSSELNNQLMLV